MHKIRIFNCAISDKFSIIGTLFSLNIWILLPTSPIAHMPFVYLNFLTIFVILVVPVLLPMLMNWILWLTNGMTRCHQYIQVTKLAYLNFDILFVTHSFPVLGSLA